MNFSHRLHVNEDETTGDALTYEQLWRGLLLKAENPLLFIEGLDDFSILARNDTSIDRELRFGEARIRDRVTFAERGRLRQEIAPSAHAGGATLDVVVDECADHGLYAEFNYRTAAPSPADDEARMVESFVRQAYVDTDRHAVAVIRRLVREGSL